jgi:hypothetical protein
MIKILVRMALAMLRFAGAPKKLIEFALNHAVLLLNRLPRSRKGMGMVVPLELWLGIKPPSILHVIKVWGCAAYSLELGQRGKFDTKVQKMVHLGYDVARCAYVLCSLPHYKVTFSAHVTFNEADFPFKDHIGPTLLPLVWLKSNLARRSAIPPPVRRGDPTHPWRERNLVTPLV